MFLRIRRNIFLFLFTFIICLINIKEVKAISTQTISYSITAVENYINNHSGKRITDFFKMVVEGYDLKNKFLHTDNYIVFIEASGNNGASGTISWFETDGNLMIWNTTSNAGISASKNNRTYQRVCNQSINFNTLGEYTGTNGSLNCVTNQPSNTQKNFPFTIAYSNYAYATYNNNNAYYPGYSYDVDNQRLTINGYNVNSNGQLEIQRMINNYYNYEITDFLSTNEPEISEPYNTFYNGYTETTFVINNYTYESVNNNYRIDIINNSNGNREFVQPTLSAEEITIVKTSYEPTSYTIQLYDENYNVLLEYNINANINYTNNLYNVNISNINTQNNTITYSYIINSSENVTCYHSVNNGNLIEDTNCSLENNTFTLNLIDNSFVAFIIKNSNNNIVFEYKENFVFNVSNPYINFIDKFENNFLTLDVIINRYQTNDIIQYSINNGNFISVSYLQDIYLDVGDVKKFTITSLNNNDNIVVQLIRNNQIIASANYNVFFNKFEQNNKFNLKDFFDTLNINNINQELANLIINIGNSIQNSSLGNLILLKFFVFVICWVLKLIV